MYNFPDNPVPGQVFEKWAWNGVAWVLTSEDFVRRAGDTMTGHLALPTGPAAANAVRKDYVDAKVASVDLSSKVSKSGDTMSGSLTINTDTPSVIFDKLSGWCGMWARKNGVARWLLRPGNDTTEGGGNTGTDFDIHRYADNGDYLGNPLNISRASGLWTIGGAVNVNANLSVQGGDLRSYRAGGGTGVVYLSSGGSYYVYWDGTRYIMPGGPLAIGSPANGGDAARVDWVDSGYLPRGGGTITGPLTVNGELVAAATYLRFNYAGSGGYIQWSGGNSYYLGSGGTIYHTGNLPDVHGGDVQSVRLAYLADRWTSGLGGMSEPWGGGVITGVGTGSDPAAGGTFGYLFRWRQLQIYVNGGWGAIGYV